MRKNTYVLKCSICLIIVFGLAFTTKYLLKRDVATSYTGGQLPETAQTTDISPLTIAPEPAAAPTPHRGYYESIPPDVRESMAGISMPAGATVGYDDLAYLTVYYHGFDGADATGHIVVAKELADEVLDIFDDLYEMGYPIESVKLIDEFQDKQTSQLNSLDRASMGTNNTSAFCYRTVSGLGNLSQHAYGRAIDLNPRINPYVTGNFVSPANAYKYADRSGNGLSDLEARAMIHKGDAVYNIFVSRGWEWGGEWYGEYDYQHFQKAKNR